MKILAISSLAVATVTFSAITFYASPFYVSQNCTGTFCSEFSFGGNGISGNVGAQAQHQTLADLSSDQQSAMLMSLGVSGSVL